MLKSNTKQKKINQAEISKAWEYWYPLVFGYFFRRVDSISDVEDLTSETLIAFFNKYEEINNANGFVWQTAKNRLFSYIKEKSKIPKSKTIEDCEFLEFSYNKYDEPKNHQVFSSNFLKVRKNIKECIEKHLKETEKEIVYLSIIEEKNSTEIGYQIGLKPATVRQKLKRSIDKLNQKCVDIYQKKAGIIILPTLFFPSLSGNLGIEETWRYIFQRNVGYLTSRQLSLKNIFDQVKIKNNNFTNLDNYSAFANASNSRFLAYFSLAVLMTSAIFGAFVYLSINSTTTNNLPTGQSNYLPRNFAVNDFENLRLANVNNQWDVLFNNLNKNNQQNNNIDAQENSNNQKYEQLDIDDTDDTKNNDDNQENSPLNSERTSTSNEVLTSPDDINNDNGKDNLVTSASIEGDSCYIWEDQASQKYSKCTITNTLNSSNFLTLRNCNFDTCFPYSYYSFGRIIENKNKAYLFLRSVISEKYLNDNTKIAWNEQVEIFIYNSDNNLTKVETLNYYRSFDPDCIISRGYTSECFPGKTDQEISNIETNNINFENKINNYINEGQIPI